MTPPKFTIARPLKRNIPDGIPGATLSTCQYCGAECWRLAIEPDPLPPGYAAACTECALRRGTHQREMDAKLAERN